MRIEQLVLDLPHRTAFGAEDFLVSQCNLDAVRLIDSWPDWEARVQLLLGPPGSGKTHLAKVWQNLSGAHWITPAELGAPLFDALAEGSTLIAEDPDRGAYDERALFHLINLANEKGLFVLLTARESPASWPYGLADLVSRLRALPRVNIGAPDEALLKAVMLKQFLDRQLDVPPKVLDFLVHRIERSLEAARRIVEAIDRQALAKGRRITRPLAAEVLRTAGRDE